MKRTLEDIYQNETDPETYLKRARATRKHKREELFAGIAIIAVVSLTFVVMQIACGIW